MGTPTAIVQSHQSKLYEAPWAATNAMPADTVTWTTGWASPFVNVGFTEDGIAIPIEIDYAESMVDQAVDPVLMVATGRSLRLETNLAEFTPANLQLATGMGTTATVAPVGPTPGPAARGHNDLAIDSSIATLVNSWGVDTVQQNGEAWRVLLYRCIAVDGPSPVLGKADQKAQTQLHVRALVDNPSGTERVGLFRQVLPIPAA